MTSNKRTQEIRAVKARGASTTTRSGFLQADGECLRLQDLVAAPAAT